MRDSWDDYARRKAPFFIATERKPLDQEFHWGEAAFFRRGAEELDMVLAKLAVPRADASEQRVRELGCGIGRRTRALAARFGHATALDISAEMLAQARANLHYFPNVQLLRGSGRDLGAVPNRSLTWSTPSWSSSTSPM